MKILNFLVLFAALASFQGSFAGVGLVCSCKPDICGLSGCQYYCERYCPPCILNGTCQPVEPKPVCPGGICPSTDSQIW